MSTQRILTVPAAVFLCLSLAMMSVRADQPQSKQPAAPAKAKEPAATKPSSPLRLVPDQIKFASRNASAQVNVFFGETAARASQVTGAAMTEKGWMFLVSKSKTDPAVVTVSANPHTAEDGSYRLAVEAGGQTAYADVFVTLSSEQQFPNLVTLLPRLDLDAFYPKGTTLEYKILGPIEAYYVWTVNGQMVQQGVGETKLNYTFGEAGAYTITVAIKNGEQIVSQSKGATKVTP
jgi:hypothetical protein